MLKKIGFAVFFFIVGGAVGIFGTMIYSGCIMARGMFILQEMDIIRAEQIAIHAFEKESAQRAIWATEYYIDFFDSALKERTTALEKESLKQDDVLIVMNPKSKWLHYIRLGLLYEEIGNQEKKEELFRQAAQIHNFPDNDAFKRTMAPLAEKLKNERQANLASLDQGKTEIQHDQQRP